jgi:LPS sulfotransferase NodH
MKVFTKSSRQFARKLVRPFRKLVRHEHRVNVCMIHIGRCGSTVLGQMLKAHKQIFWTGEFYNRYLSNEAAHRSGGVADINFPEDPLHALLEKMQSRKADVFGIEVKPFHYHLMGLPVEQFVSRLGSLGFTHYIILDRNNRLRKIVSSVIASQADNKYHIHTAEQSQRSRVFLDVNSVKIDYDDKSLLGFLQDYDQQFSRVSACLSDKPLLRLSYEEHIQNDPEQAFSLVCEFLGLPAASKVRKKLVRTNPYPLSELITNYDEVTDYLAGTPYEWMLQD